MHDLTPCLLMLSLTLSCGGPQRPDPEPLRAGPAADDAEVGDEAEAGPGAPAGDPAEAPSGDPAEAPSGEPAEPPPPSEPTLSVDTETSCLYRDCIRHDGFPAISADGTRVAAVTEVPLVVYGPTPDETSTLVFEVRTTDGGNVENTVELVTEGDRMARYQMAMDCCDISDINCDPYLCAPDEETVAVHERDMAATARRRVAEAAAILREGEFLSLAPVPPRAADGPSLSLEIEDDEWSSQVSAVRIVVHAGGEAPPILDRRVEVRCGDGPQDCVDVEVNAWTDGERGVVVALLIAVDDEGNGHATTFVERATPTPAGG